MPWAAETMRQAIPAFIGILLFLALLRILPDSRAAASFRQGGAWSGTLLGVVLAQIGLPLLVLLVMTIGNAPPLWSLAAALVAAAPPISGCPNLVLLLRGDAALAMRWLMLGTAILPLSCLPVMYLLFPEQSVTTLLRPALVLLALIGTSILLAVAVLRLSRSLQWTMNADALDGLGAVVLALMVIGLMAAVHDPHNGWPEIGQALMLAVIINVGFQCLGVIVSVGLKRGRSCSVATGVANGNRNIALFLAALPAGQMESLLLFIACYQVPMYLTPLLGDLFYGRLE